MPKVKLAPLLYDQLYPMALSLARRIARIPSDVDDLVQVGLLAAYTDAVRQAKLGVENPHALAWTTLRRAMWGYYNTPDERAAKRTDSVDASPWLDLPDSEQTDLLNLSEYFDALERSCGPLARQIAENLVSPDEICSAAIADEIKRKRRRGAYSQRAPRARISHKLMRTALGISKGRWTGELTRIRAFTRSWLG